MLHDVVDAGVLAGELGISREAVELTRASDFIDLHLDGFVWTRIVGYDLRRRHERPLSRGVFGGHLDFPRARDAGLSGGLWSITTNPFRTRAGRRTTLVENMARLQAMVHDSDGQAEVVRSVSEYRAARARGAHGVFVVIQGANALDPDRDLDESLGRGLVSSVTLVHLLSSFLGKTSTPVPLPGPALSKEGERYVQAMEAAHVLVDLAHIHPDGFWRVVDVHDKGVPLVVTHTGVSHVRPHWRNLDDAQIRAIADSGGVVGVIFQRSFIARAGERATVDTVVDHVAHIIEVGGEDTAAIGTDYDGMIVPPDGLEDGRALPRLTAAMLARGWTDTRIQKILGGNYLSCMARVRP
jgi:membrane dipeptidase